MKRIAVISIIVLVIIGLCVGGYFAYMSITEKARYDNLDLEECTSTPKNAIYFLNTGSSDAIVLKSGEHLAMIDAGEDSDNPRGFEALALEGYEIRVLDFIKSFAGDDGKVYLDFVLGTHAHSDHIGGFDTIINDDSVVIEKAYLKEYRPEFINEMEIEEWDNQEVYDQMVTALNNKNVPIISNISNDTFVFGDFRLTILNTGYESGSSKVGENDNSLAVLAEINGVKALLCGDLDNKSADEIAVAERTGRVDILKLGHHSYNHSTGSAFLKYTRPSLCVVTNNSKNADKRTIRRIMRLTKAPVIYSDDEQGICISFDCDAYKAYNNACIY